MADQQTTFRLRFENEDMQRVFEQVIARIDETENALKDLEKAQASQAQAAAQEGKKANDALKDQAQQLDTNKVKFREMGDRAGEALQSIADQGGAATSTLARLARAAGPVGIAIAAIGTAVTASFLSVRSNALAARRELEGVRAVGNELAQRTFASIRGITKQILGDVVGASLEFERAFGSLRRNLGDVRSEALALLDFQQAVQQGSRNIARAEAERGAQIERLRILAADERRSTADRIGLIRQAAGEESELNERRAFQLTNEIALIKAQNKEWATTPEILDDIAGLEVQIAELRGASAVIQLQTQAEVNALLREEAEARARILEAIRDANAITTGTQAERAIEKQIQAFRELRDAVTAAGLGNQFADELASLDEVIGGLETRLSDGLVKSLEGLPDTLRESLRVEDVFGNELVKQVESSIDSQAQRFIDEGARVAKLINTGVVEQVEKLSEEQKQFFGDVLGGVFQDVSNIIIGDTLIAINRQQELIDARQETIRRLEEQINEEDRLREQGLANQSNRLREALSKERSLLQQEQEKRLELQRKAARQQLVVDSLTQASSLTLAAANLLKEGSKGFLPGLIIAAAGIALLFRIIAQAKANAVQFSSVPRFRAGTEYVEGPGTGTSDSIAAFISRGERIVPADLNEELGGRRLTNEELVELVKIGQVYAESPDLSGRTTEDAIAPMEAAIAGGAAAQRQIEEAAGAIREASMARVFANEMQRMRDHITAEMAARPIDTPLDRPIVREYRKGKTKIKEVIRPK